MSSTINHSAVTDDTLRALPTVRLTLELEETCPATGTPIRVIFSPGHVDHVEPADTVVALIHQHDRTTTGQTASTQVCSQMPLFASAAAAQEWLAAHPGAQVLPIREAWDLSVRDRRDRIPAAQNHRR